MHSKVSKQNITAKTSSDHPESDSGHDDPVAILLADGNPNIDLLGIASVGVNQTLEKVSFNARQVLTIAKLVDVSLYAGETRPSVHCPR